MLTKGLVGIIALFFSLRSYIGSFSGDKLTNSDLLDEYDFIIVGSGASGSVLAKRLSDTTDNTVLLVEAGPPGHGDVAIETPFLVNQLQQTFRDWQFQTSIQTGFTPAKILNLPQGKVGGGNTAINYLMYNRGSRHDYNSWRDKGATGWDYNSITKYFKNVEKADTNMSNTLGSSGELGLSYGIVNDFVQFILNVADQIGYPQVDYSDGGLAEGFSIPVQTTDNGIRQFAGNAYLWNSLKNDNLHASFNTVAYLVTFDQNSNLPRATGVEVKLPNGKNKHFGARKEVILCAGAINSPQLLMLSGIGPKNHLSRYLIPLVKDLPGVGSNLQDHVTVPTYFYVDDHLSFGKFTDSEMYSSFLDYLFHGKGPMAMPSGPTVIGHLRSGYFGTPSGSSSFRYPYPELQYMFVQKEVKVDDVTEDKVERHEVAAANMNRNGVMYNMFTKTTLLHPKSRGTIRLISTSIHKQPVIDPRYLTNQDDVKVLVDGLKTLELFENSLLFRMNNITMVMNNLCDKTEVKKSDRSDAFYECLVKTHATTGHSLCCTNSIGYKQDGRAVVDHNLRVHGVAGLRVADASVMPHLTSSHIQAACYVIGEKAADIIKKDWNI